MADEIVNTTQQINSDQDKTVTLDGIDYRVIDLSEEAKQQIMNVRATDMEINRLNLQLSIAQTARASYALALNQALPQPKGQ